MWHALTMVLGSCLVGAPADDLSKAMAGHWSFDGNGHRGEMIVEAVRDGKIAGTIDNHRLVGTFDADTGRVIFRRMQDANDAAGRQVYSGVLARVAGAKPARYTLEGTFTSTAGMPWGKADVAYPWHANAQRRPSPAEDLAAIQGRWEVRSVYHSNHQERDLPAEIPLGERGATIVVRGNQLLADGKVVATLANDVTSPALEAEKGFKIYRLLVLTLPDGRGLLGSYYLDEERLAITYPHTTQCHRGTGQIINLNRPAK